jgi:hypothetical protein
MPIDYADPQDWSQWEQFRDQVVHPAGTIKAEDIERARENIARHGWAREYAQKLEEDASRVAARVDHKGTSHSPMNASRSRRQR